MRLNLNGMASSRDQCDLWLVLTDPQCARIYISNFDWQDFHIPDRIEVDSGRMIDLVDISDADAVVVASFLLREYQIPREMADKNLEQWEQ